MIKGGDKLPPKPKSKNGGLVTKSVDGEFAEYKEMIKRIE